MKIVVKIFIAIIFSAVIYPQEVEKAFFMDFTDTTDIVAIIFSEPMDSSVLIYENYDIRTVSTTSVPQTGQVYPLPIVIRTDFYNDSTVQLLTTEHILGYFQIEANNVYDLAGNLIDPLHNKATYSKLLGDVNFLKQARKDLIEGKMKLKDD
ncbi:MAG: hypothetical protein GY804_09750 [Alphaproteobacteria bacterium]|nr:hypothetical protein [Alphaproteobacteria bacterium]